MRTIHFTLNGEKASAEIATHHTIVEMLRDRFDLFGARESCAQGLCGCCTVLVDGRAVSGCLYLAAFADGAEVVTVEHLAVTMLNHELRPFLSKWHPRLREFEKAHPDGQESAWPDNIACRGELRHAQVHLVGFALGFARLAGVREAEAAIAPASQPAV